MKKLLKTLVSAILLLTLLAGSLLACSDVNQPSETTAATTSPASADTTVAATETEVDTRYDENGYLKDEIGDFDYNNKEFVILHWSDYSRNEFTSEGNTGDAVNDAIYRRNCKVEERCKIKLTFTSTAGNTSNMSNFANKVKTMTTSGTEGLDLVATHGLTAGYTAQTGVYTDLNQGKYLEFDKPWWPKSLISQITINNKIFFVSGDISTNCIYLMYCTFFNKKILEERKIEDPYTLAKTGKWTIDKMWELCKGVYEDTNANQASDNGDLVGNTFYQINLDAYVVGAGLTFLQVKDNEIILNEDIIGDRGVNIFDKILAFTKDTTCTTVLPAYASSFNQSNARTYFADGLSLFYVDPCVGASKFQEGNISYGIVPVPKGSEDQENYFTCVGNGFSMYSIPVTTTDYDYATSVIEIMASESYRSVTPVLYDTVIKYRMAEDLESANMFDVIRENMVFDLARMYGNNFGTIPYTTMEKTIMNGSSWATIVSSNLKGWKTNLKKLGKEFE